MTWAKEKARDYCGCGLCYTPERLGCEADMIEKIIGETVDEAVQWVRAEARDCGCFARIEAHLRALMRGRDK